MNSKRQIAVIAPDAALPILTNAVRAAAAALPEPVEFTCCAVCDAVTPLMLTAADAVIAGAAVEQEADELKLTEILQRISQLRSSDRQQSVIAVVLWGAAAAELAQSLDHPAIVCTATASNEPPQHLIEQRLAEALPLINPLETVGRYQLLTKHLLSAWSFESAALPQSVSTGNRLQNFIDGFRPAVRRLLQQELEALRQTLSITRAEYSAAVIRQLELETVRESMRSELAALRRDHGRLQEELKANAAELATVQHESRRIRDRAQREIDGILTEHTRRITETLGALSDCEARIRLLTGQVRELTTERDSLKTQLQPQPGSAERNSLSAGTASADVLIIPGAGVATAAPVQPAIEAEHDSFLNESFSDRGRVDVAEVIEEVCRMVHPLQSESRLSVSVEVEPEARFIHSNRMLLGQILFNLMSNAVCYTFRGMVTVTARRKADAVTISVSDTGTGLSREQLEEIFNQESEAWKNATSECGLPATQRLIAELSGQLEVKSAVNAGSTFSVTFSQPAPQAEAFSRAV
ncbi:MAG: ATP-binding protein [Blastocatellia bacterium]